jgi:hypothetical protein
VQKSVMDAARSQTRDLSHILTESHNIPSISALGFWLQNEKTCIGHAQMLTDSMKQSSS